MEELKNTIDTLEKKDEECIELKNIKYKSALFNKNNNNNKETILINNISNPFATNNSGKLLKVVKKVYLKTILDSIKQQLQ